MYLVFTLYRHTANKEYIFYGTVDEEVYFVCIHLILVIIIVIYIYNLKCTIYSAYSMNTHNNVYRIVFILT